MTIVAFASAATGEDMRAVSAIGPSRHLPWCSDTPELGAKRKRPVRQVC
jgi:hypothetical protein